MIKTLKKIGLKLFAFFIRVNAIVYGLMVTIVGAFALISSDPFKEKPFITFEFWLIFLAGLILIFPFRFLKSYRALNIYFYLLLSVTLSHILFGWQLGGFISHLILSILLSLNFFIVYLFIRYKQNPNLINPLLEKRDHSIFLLLFFTFFISFVYLSVDIRTSSAGFSLFRNTFETPGVSIDLNPKALKSEFTFYDTTLGTGKKYEIQTPVIIITSPIINGDDFIELYQDGKKIHRLDYSPRGIKTITAYDPDGTKHEYVEDIGTFQAKGVDGLTHDYPIYESKLLARDKSNQLVILKNEGDVSRREDLDFTIIYRSIWKKPNDFIVGTPGAKLEKIELTVTKNVKYPSRPKYIPLPFFRSTQDWKLSLKTSKTELPVVNKLHLWY